jgi:hypothetical protein
MQTEESDYSRVIDRQKSEPPWDRLRGPLPDPPLGYQTPIEETVEALHESGEGRQGAIYRCFRHVRVAVSEGAARRREVWLDPLRLDAGSPQSNLPRRGAGDAAALSRGENRGDPIRQVIERVAEIAEKRGVPRGHIALAWLLKRNRLLRLSSGNEKSTRWD